MKKNIIMLALITVLMCVLYFSGCLPSSNTNSPSLSPDQTPFPIPSPPLPADDCPSSFTTTIVPVRTMWGIFPWDPEFLGRHFRILLSFDEAITLLDDNPTHWGVLVRRAVPWIDEATFTEQQVMAYNLPAFVYSVEQFGNRIISLEVLVADDGASWPAHLGRKNPLTYFYGLICSEADYEVLLKGITGASASNATKYADQVVWSYRGSFAFADAAGYPCPESCSIGGLGCCVVPCPDCPEPVEWCPVGGC